MSKENRYEFAIKHFRAVDFLLGKREFLYEDDEFSSELHVPHRTFIDIVEYGEKHGEEKMLNRFKKDIKKALKTKLTPNDFLTVSTYIYIYMLRFYNEKKLVIEWIPDEETKKLIKKNYANFLNQFDPSEDFNYQSPTQSNGFFLHNTISNYKFIKERFGVDLLE